MEQLILAPVNGIYGLLSPVRGFVDTATVGRLFGQIGVIVFIMSIGAFISISFATRSLEVAVAALANRLRSRGWLLIAAVMVLFSLLGSTMGFSVETFGFYALFIPLMAALGYDRLVTAAMIIVGATIGVMASTVNPFSIGVAAGEAGVGIGDGIVLRLILWVVLTAMAVGWVLRYAARVRANPSASLVGFDEDVRRRRMRPPIGRTPRRGNPEMGARDHRLRLRADDLLGHPLVEHLRRHAPGRPTIMSPTGRRQSSPSGSS